MVNPKFYKLAGWGLIMSSFYFTWKFFFIGAFVLHDLATNRGSGIFTDLTQEVSVTGLIEMFFADILLGVALTIGGIFVLKRMGTRTNNDRCKDQI